MKFVFMKTYSSEFRVQKMADALGVTRSAYYAWKKRGESKRSKENGRLLGQIRVLHAGSHEIYGSRRIRGRNAGCPAPPAQTRTCSFSASGSSVVLASAPDDPRRMVGYSPQ